MTAPLILIGSCVLILLDTAVSSSNADVTNLRRYNQHYSRLTEQRLQRQKAVTPYPAAGYRPSGPQFTLPNEESQPDNFDDNNLGSKAPFTPESSFAISNAIDQPITRPSLEMPQEPASVNVNKEPTPKGLPRRPDFTYGVPPGARIIQATQKYRISQQQHQQLRSAARSRSSFGSAALNANREEIENDDSASDSDIEVGIRDESETKSLPAVPTAQFQPATTVYYPASAVGFVQPLSLTPVALPAAAPSSVVAGTYTNQPSVDAITLQPAIGSFMGTPTTESDAPAKLQAQQSDSSSPAPIAFPTDAAVPVTSQNFGYFAQASFPSFAQYTFAPSSQGLSTYSGHLQAW